MGGARLLCLGAIAAAHGVKGLVKIKSFTAEPEAIAAYGPLCDEAGRVFRLSLKGRSGDLLLAAIEGVTDRTAAERLRGQRLFVARAVLPALSEPESYYEADLIGLRVETLAGEPLGQVSALADYGAGAILVVQGKGGERLLPFTNRVVPKVELEAGRLLVDPPQEIEVKSDE